MRAERKEELVVGDRPAADEIGALAEIVEEERRIDDGVPGDADRQRAEMADVGVHRLAPGDHQHQGAEDQKRLEEMRAAQKLEAVERIEGHRESADWPRSATAPSAAIAANQTSTIGPNTEPTAEAPWN